jgi:hypothetical protein
MAFAGRIETGTDARSLREILAERKAKIAQYVPAPALAVHARAVAALKGQGLAAKSLAIGARAPQFSIPDHNGAVVSSAELLAGGRLVVCFFRGR